MRQRSPILNLLQLAIVGFIFWQVYRARVFEPGGNPMEGADAMFRSIGLVFMGVFAIFILNLLYPLVAWGIGRLRDRQETGERLVVSPPETSGRQERTCTDCGASLFDDAPACPWCGHPPR